MRLGLAFQIAVAVGVLSSASHAFTRPAPQTLVRSLCALHVGGQQGWDNENFLDSLSNGPDAIDSANERYQAFSENRAAHAEYLRRKMAEQNDDDAASAEEDSQGGSRFKEMLNKSKEVAPAASEGRRGPILYNPTEGLKPDPSQTPPAQGADDLSIEEQARMFRAFMANAQNAPDAVPQKSKKSGGRKMGRNRDADTIANTADLYFAQLKRDSTVRTIARYTGDEEKANAVFEDDSVQELKGLLKTNPHLKDAGDSKLLDTSADEMIAVMKLTAGSGEEEDTGTRSVPNYKQKLMERRKKMGDRSTVSLTSPEAPPKPVEKPEPAVTEPKAPVAKTQAVTPTAPVSKPQAPAAPAAKPQATTPVAAAAAPQAPATSLEGGDPEEIRRTIRTLMGLLLKHRGGPGFGKGRLKGPEVQRFESTLAQVTELLQSEAGGAVEKEVAPPVVSAPPQPLATTPPPATSTPSAAAGATAVPAQERMTSTVACVEGAVQMYKNSPPELQESSLMTLRAALVAAVNTCNEVVGEESPVPPAPAVAASADEVQQRMASTIACVEGAVQMYKNSPPELQQSTLVTLRSALMAAVNTCNQVIAEGEVQNVQAYQKAVPTQPAEAPPSPGKQFFNVEPYTPDSSAGEDKDVSSTSEASPPVATHSGTDENSQLLQKVYNSLVAAEGDQKFGLGKLSKAEANALADQLVEMKGTLMEELDSGIPEASPASVASSGAGNQSGQSSNYQKMLAKAKAAKAAKNA